MKNSKYSQFHDTISKTKKSNIKNPIFIKHIENEINKSNLKQFDKNCLLRYLKT